MNLHQLLNEQESPETLKLIADFLEMGLGTGGILDDWDEIFTDHLQEEGKEAALKYAKNVDEVVKFMNRHGVKRKIYPNFYKEAKYWTMSKQEQRRADVAEKRKRGPEHRTTRPDPSPEGPPEGE